MPVPQEEAGVLGEGEGALLPAIRGSPPSPQCPAAAGGQAVTLDDSLGRVIIIIGPAKHRAVFMQEFIYLRREMVEKASGQADGSPGWSALEKGTQTRPLLPAGAPEESLI